MSAHVNMKFLPTRLALPLPGLSASARGIVLSADGDPARTYQPVRPGFDWSLPIF